MLSAGRIVAFGAAVGLVRGTHSMLELRVGRYNISRRFSVDRMCNPDKLFSW